MLYVDSRVERAEVCSEEGEYSTFTEELFSVTFQESELEELTEVVSLSRLLRLDERETSDVEVVAEAPSMAEAEPEVNTGAAEPASAVRTRALGITAVRRTVLMFLERSTAFKAFVKSTEDTAPCRMSESSFPIDGSKATFAACLPLAKTLPLIGVSQLHTAYNRTNYLSFSSRIFSCNRSSLM